MNRKFILVVSICFAGIGLLTMQGCKADKLPVAENPTFCDSITATYNASVKAIMDAKCALPSCHGGPQSPSFVDYTAISSVTDRIAIRALDLQTMPPSGMPQLTNEELDIMNCWRNAGFPEQ